MDLCDRELILLGSSLRVLGIVDVNIKDLLGRGVDYLCLNVIINKR